MLGGYRIPPEHRSPQLSVSNGASINPEEAMSMHRSVYTSDHEEFRKTVRSFIEREVVPEFDHWYQDGTYHAKCT